MLNVGLAGIGFMGMIHWLAYQRVPGLRVVAICTRDPKKRAGDWRSIQGNFGPRGIKVDLSGVRTYERLDDLLIDSRIDLVDICLPPRMHAEAAIGALSAGKHVFCEKPIAMESRDARRMMKAAATAGKQLLIGHIVPFFPEYTFALAAARNHKYGRLLGGHLKRIIAEPAATDYFNRREIGGPLLDLHIHDVHFIRLLLGMPQAVFSTGRMRGELVEYIDSQFLFADSDVAVSAGGGVIKQQGRSFSQGFELRFERATLAYDFAVLDGKPHLAMPLAVLEDGNVRRPKIGSPDPADSFVAEIREVAESIKRGEPSPALTAEIAADALALCQKEAESIRLRRLVKI